MTRRYAHQLNEIRNCFCSIVRANVVVLNPMPYCCNKKHPVGVIFITGGSAGLYIPMFAFAPWAPFGCGSNPNATTSLFRGFSSNHRNIKIKCPKGHLIFMADGEGFEPPVELPPQRFSRPPHSTALPTILNCFRRSFNLRFWCFAGLRPLALHFADARSQDTHASTRSANHPKLFPSVFQPTVLFADRA